MNADDLTFVLDEIEAHFGGDRCCWSASRESTNDRDEAWGVDFVLYAKGEEDEEREAEVEVGASGPTLSAAALGVLKQLVEAGMDAPPLVAWAAGETVPMLERAIASTVEACAVLIERVRCRQWSPAESAHQLREHLKRGWLFTEGREKFNPLHRELAR